jgi:hypothetical protein
MPFIVPYQTMAWTEMYTMENASLLGPHIQKLLDERAKVVKEMEAECFVQSMCY